MRSEKLFSLLLPILFLISFRFNPVYADSSYVLPYPSTMPGNSIYKIHTLYERLLRYWYFGDFGAFEYNIRESDKYLVESKTLFEYKQYLLAYNSLQLSDQYFLKIKPALLKAQKDGKNISEKNTIMESEAQKHIEVLTDLEKIVPSTIIWSPENSTPSTLKSAEEINNSIKIRNKVL